MTQPRPHTTSPVRLPLQAPPSSVRAAGLSRLVSPGQAAALLFILLGLPAPAGSMAALPGPSKNTNAATTTQSAQAPLPSAGAPTPLALLTSVGVGYPLTLASGGRYNHYEGVGAVLVRTGILYPSAGAMRVALGVGVHRLVADSVVKEDRTGTTVLAFPFILGLHLRHGSTLEVPLFVSLGYAQRRFDRTRGHDATRYLSAGAAVRWRFGHVLDDTLAFVLAPSAEVASAGEGANSTVGSHTMLLLGVSLSVERNAR